MKRSNFFYIAVIVVLGLFLSIGMALVVKNRGNNKAKTPVSSPKAELVETPLEERPYVSLTPSADAHEITLNISRIMHGQSVEYEFSYQTKAGLSQGAIGTIDLKGKSETSRKFLLGACSKNVCRYDEGVEEGSLLLRFRDDDKVRKFFTEFRLQKDGGQLSSADGKFTLIGKFPVNVYFIVMSTIGLPENLEEEKISSSPYGVFSSGTVVLKDSEVLLTGEGENNKIFFWGGKSWETLGNSPRQPAKNVGVFVAASAN